MSENNSAWPPPYVVKKHAKAKYVKLRASKTFGIEITVPKRFSVKHIPNVLEENRVWILRQLANIKLSTPLQLPHEINFASINQIWKIFYEPLPTKPRLLKRPGNEIVLLGDVNDKNLCAKLLLRWVKGQAKIHLQQELTSISRAIKLPYQQLTIRDQKTRWGSCTSDGNISLNYKLLLLPTLLMQYVIIHELCHTKHLNHSDKFWRLVEMHDPDWRKHRSLIRKADEILPDWITQV